MTMQTQTAITTTNPAGNGLAIKLNEIEQAIKEYTPVLRELIVGGRTLTPDQIRGRLMFGLTNGLNPITEVHTITDNQGKTMAHTMAVNGLRRKNQEAVGPTVEIALEFQEMTEAELQKYPTALVGYRCRIRDGELYTKWQKRVTELGKVLREAVGGPVSVKDILDMAGPPPVTEGIGIFYKDEQSPYKDKNYNPAERAKKRAEVNARHHRWPTEVPVYEGSETNIVTDSGIEVTSHPEESQTRQTPEATEAQYHDEKPGTNQILAELGFAPEPPKAKVTYTREDAAAKLAQPELVTEEVTAEQEDNEGKDISIETQAIMDALDTTLKGRTLREYTTEELKNAKAAYQLKDAEKGLSGEQIQMLEKISLVINSREAQA